MNRIYSALQLMNLYKQACQTMGVSRDDLIERSAKVFVSLFTQMYRPVDYSVHIFAGYADNGAIALAVARLLVDKRIPVRAYLFHAQGAISELCEVQRLRSKQAGVDILSITNKFDPPTLSDKTIIIDGLFGSEATSALEGGFIPLVKWLNGLGREIVSIDLPSGILADSNIGSERVHAVRANRTITFDAPRLAMLMKENAPYVGRWYIASLELDSELYEQSNCTYYYQSEEAIGRELLIRKPFSTKADYGKALLIGGSSGRYGQLCLATQASILMGIGELHVACSDVGHIPLTLAAPEAILTSGSHPLNIPEQLRSYQAIAIGTAMSNSDLSADDLRNIFSSYRQPMVLDGIAIDLIADNRSLLDIIPEGSILLLDGRTKEALLGMHFSDMDYLEAAKKLAGNREITIVLKGTYTAVCRGSGHVYFSLKGNPGMATNGMGDILSGLILGLLARGYDTLMSVLIASYLHGTAGDYIAARTTEESLTASQLLREIPEMLRHLSE